MCDHTLLLQFWVCNLHNFHFHTHALLFISVSYTHTHMLQDSDFTALQQQVSGGGGVVFDCNLTHLSHSLILIHSLTRTTQCSPLSPSARRQGERRGSPAAHECDITCVMMCDDQLQECWEVAVVVESWGSMGRGGQKKRPLSTVSTAGLHAQFLIVARIWCCGMCRNLRDVLTKCCNDNRRRQLSCLFCLIPNTWFLRFFGFVHFRCVSLSSASTLARANRSDAELWQQLHVSQWVTWHIPVVEATLTNLDLSIRASVMCRLHAMGSDFLCMLPWCTWERKSCDSVQLLPLLHQLENFRSQVMVKIWILVSLFNILLHCWPFTY